MKRTIAIGDVHGCFYSVKDLLGKVSYNPSNDRLIFLGDYIDRGKHSYEVINALMELKQEYGDNVICLRGNHEQMFINYVDGYGSTVMFVDWLFNGGNHTIDSFSRKGKDMREYITWFKSMPLVCESKNFIFCHAGLSEPTVLETGKDSILWNREWIENDSRKREKTVVFGHTPFDSVKFTNSGDIGIDLGCVFGRKLCAMIIEEDGTYKFATVKTNYKDMW